MRGEAPWPEMGDLPDAQHHADDDRGHGRRQQKFAHKHLLQGSGAPPSVRPVGSCAPVRFEFSGREGPTGLIQVKAAGIFFPRTRTLGGCERIMIRTGER